MAREHKKRLLVQYLSLGVLITVATGCSAPVDGSSDDLGSTAEPLSSNGTTRVATDTTADDPESPPPPSGPLVVYYGGEVIERAEVWALTWGKEVAYRWSLPKFYGMLTRGPYFGWLREYSTGTQAIHRGRFMGLLFDYEAPTVDVIGDQDIQIELARYLHARPWLRVGKNTIFAVHFPPNTTVTRGTRRSCYNFCAYHGSFNLDGSALRYTVVPDLSGCSGRCGGLSALDDTLVVSSHELIEAVTDPDYQFAKGWYDPTYGEIGDICAYQTETVAGFVIQKGWSNRAGTCISGFERPGDDRSDTDSEIER